MGVSSTAHPSPGLVDRDGQASPVYLKYTFSLKICILKPGRLLATCQEVIKYKYRHLFLSRIRARGFSLGAIFLLQGHLTSRLPSSALPNTAHHPTPRCQLTTFTADPITAEKSNVKLRVKELQIDM